MKFNFYLAISITAGIFSFALGLWVLWKDKHIRANQIFSIGMILLGAEAVFNGISLSTYDPMQAHQWQRGRIFLSSFYPGIWFLFSVIFGNQEYSEKIKRWKWVIGLLFVLPALIYFGYPRSFLIDVYTSIQKGLFLFRLGWAGYIFHVIILLGFVAVLVQLERILRSSVGRTRWRIKFVVLGLLGLWGERVYEISQTLLYWEIDLQLQVMNNATIIVVSGLMAVGFMRMPSLQLSLYPSRVFLYNSITILLAGIYFIFVGILAKIAAYSGTNHGAILGGFVIFVAILGLAILVFSDRLNRRVKRFITLHLGRPSYDYQKEWLEFTRETSSVLEMRGLSRIIARRISKMMDVLSVTIWLVDSSLKKIEVAGSTSYVEKSGTKISDLSRVVLKMIQAIREKNLPCEYNFLDGDWIDSDENIKILREERIEYCLPLKAGKRFLGVITLGERVGEHPLSVEDFELLKTITDQTAASLLNLKLSEELLLAKEREAFQRLSTFLLHDLKNLASNLSLILGNMEAHFENPEFRKDVLIGVERSLNKIKNMCSGLSLLSNTNEVKKEYVDLNCLVNETLKIYDGKVKGKIIKDLRLSRDIFADREQIFKVLTNLLLNANEAMSQGGEIRVETGLKNGWAILLVADSGCGMSREFMEKSLFRPFKTSKRQGMGIGLFHSKMIIEAHGGKIEVESEEKVGSVFRVLLPLN